ncbi:hypothetical protein PRK78_000138 [Emydomyces testavorans]|uniref:Uncharacterized protein n=1 Tax=Emydomyces testavorans TaxID=2070801 RepID=A0AAF0IE53_9EURO|nr:hypothetical protein PRK78_000138 [Emydomyces testavorans]
MQLLSLSPTVEKACFSKDNKPHMYRDSRDYVGMNHSKADTFFAGGNVQLHEHQPAIFGGKVAGIPLNLMPSISSSVCDQREPACGQCLRANYICPGYRDQLDLLFRDETQKIAKKARTTSKPTDLSRLQDPIRTRPAESSRSPNAGNAPRQALPKSIKRHQNIQNNSLFVSRPLPADLKYQAVCYFLASYAPPIRSSGPNRLGYLPLVQCLIDNEALAVCMSAVGLASLSNITKSRTMWLAAREQYTSALALINARLHSPIHVKSIMTLDAVMLLGMFEVITCRSPQSLNTWRSHMQGATALLKLVSQERSKGSATSATFVQVRGQILSGCLVSETYAPPSAYALLEEDRSKVTRAEVILEDLTRLLARLANLRASIKEGVVSAPLEILCMALNLRADLISFAHSVKLTYAFQKVKNQDGKSMFFSPDFVYGEYFHVFPDFYAVNVWNGYYSARITLNATIFKYFSQLQSSSSPLDPPLPGEIYEKIEQDQRDMNQVAKDICATVPFALGMVRWDSNTVSVDPTGTCALGGFLLLWPLYLAAEAADAQLDLRAWVISRFEYIGRSFGINQALWMADMIKEKSSIHESITSESSELE